MCGFSPDDCLKDQKTQRREEDGGELWTSVLLTHGPPTAAGSSDWAPPAPGATCGPGRAHGCWRVKLGLHTLGSASLFPYFLVYLDANPLPSDLFLQGCFTTR